MHQEYCYNAMTSRRSNSGGPPNKRIKLSVRASRRLVPPLSANMSETLTPLEFSE